MIEGVSITLGGREFILPSLTFRQVRQFSADGTLEKVPMNGATFIAKPECRDAAEVVLFAALSRNYPDLKLEQMADLLDLNVVEAAVAAVMGVSGLTRRTAPGEAGAASP
jgi:hypothetical protein